VLRIQESLFMDRKNDTGTEPAPENRDQQTRPAPLSDQIPNAHAAGDGALGKSDESEVKPRKTAHGDEAIKKEPENY
jgi:hypothetical protein